MVVSRGFNGLRPTPRKPPTLAAVKGDKLKVTGEAGEARQAAVEAPS
jgi:hypothetical protein